MKTGLIYAIAVVLMAPAVVSCEKGKDNRGDSSKIKESAVINGVKWATRNVDKPGTFAAGFKDAGMFYQWNRRIGWSVGEPLINTDGGTEWNATNEPGESWAAENDPCPTGYKMPEQADFEALCDLEKVSREWVAGSGNTLGGWTFTDSDSGESMFLPAAGARTDKNILAYVGENCLYWSATSAGTSLAGGIPLASGLRTYEEGGETVIDPANSFNSGGGFSARCVSNL